MKKLIPLLMIATITVSCGSEQSSQTEKSAGKSVKVNVVETSEQQMASVLNYSGLIAPSLRVPMSFKQPGTIIAVHVEEGDRVKKGQVLAELDQTTYQSVYASAAATQRQAQDAYDRLKTVYEKGSLPEIKWEDTKAKLEQANSSLKIAEQNLENCSIKSPIDGIIGSRSIEEGENATPNITVLEVVSMNEVYARFSVPENEINKIQKGQTANVSVPAVSEHQLQGTVTKKSIIANTISKTFEVKITISNPDLAMKPGMVCDVTLPLQKNKVGLLVPVQSVLKDASGTNYVYVVDRQTQTANRRDVQVEGVFENKLSISSGLIPGEWLVVEGNKKLSNNIKIIPN